MMAHPLAGLRGNSTATAAVAVAGGRAFRGREHPADVWPASVGGRRVKTENRPRTSSSAAAVVVVAAAVVWARARSIPSYHLRRCRTIACTKLGKGEGLGVESRVL